MKLKNTFTLSIIFLFLILSVQNINAQTSGLIFEKTNPHNNILDPDNDGYVSSDTLGFQTNDLTESEISFIPLPVLETEPSSDQLVGPDCSYIDIVDNGTKNALYVYSDGTYLIFRFRLGGTASNAKSYSILVDSDKKFGFTGNEADPDAVVGNPGFEFEIVLKTESGVGLYDVNGTNTPTESGNAATDRPYTSFSQKSIALTTTCGNPDYFYDFYVPMADLSVFGINNGTPLRFVGATVSDTTAFIGSSEASDIGGTDEFYFDDIFDCIPPITVTEIATGNTNTDCRTACPAITGVIADGATTVTGTSTEQDGTLIEVFKNGSSIGTPSVSTGTWSLTGISPALSTGDTITATAKDGDRYVSFNDCDIEIVNSICTTTPYNLTVSPGNKGVKGDINASSGTIITLFNIDGTKYTDANFTNPITTSSVNEHWKIEYSPPTALPDSNYYVTAQAPGQCESDPAFICVGYPSTSNTPVITTDPILNTTTLIDGTGGVLPGKMYIFSSLGSIGNTSVSGNTWSVNIANSQAACDSIYAIQIESGKCFAADTGYIKIASHKPEIIGNYCIPSEPINLSVTGTSVEEINSVIEVYINGSSAGTTLVSANGAWELTNVTLNFNDIITAKIIDGPSCLSESQLSDAITVTQASVSAATINSPNYEGNTSVSGTCQNNASPSKIFLYQDGSYIGYTDVFGTTWDVINIDPSTLYAGGILTVTRAFTGQCESNYSLPDTVLCNLPAKLTLSAVQTEYCENENAEIIVHSSENDVVYTPIFVSDGSDAGYSKIGDGNNLTLTTFPLTNTSDLTVKAEKLSGISCESYTDTVSIQINSLPDNSLNVSPSSANICRYDSVDITITGAEFGVSYQLQNASDDSNIGSSAVGDGTNPLTISTGPLDTDITIKVNATNYNHPITNCSVDLTNTVYITVSGALNNQNVTVDNDTICQNNSTLVNIGTYNDSFFYQLKRSSDNNTVGSSFFGDGNLHSISTGNLTADDTFYVEIDNGAGCTIRVLDEEKVVVNACERDILLEKTVDDNTPDEGQTIIFTIKVTNNHPTEDVTNLVVTDNLPAGLTFQSATPSTGSWSYPDWSVGTLSNSTFATLTVNAKVDNGTSGTVITNTVSNTQYETDDNTTTDDDSESITVTNTADLSVTQNGNEAGGPLAIIYTVTLNAVNNTGSAITFNFNDSGTGTATSGTDYTAVPGGTQISIPNGSSTGSVSIPVLDDAIYEPTETVDCQISNPSNPSVNINIASASANILNDENAPTVTLSANPLSITENGGSSTLTATLSVPTYEDVTVNLSYSGTAVFGTDYTSDASITILAGNTDAVKTLTATDNAIYEGDKTVIVDINSISGGGAAENGVQTTTITIAEDENAPTVTLSSNPGTITENPVSTSTLTATLSVATYEDVIVNLAYSGTATGTGSDYTAAASITISAGNLSGTTDITSVDDAIYENNETIITDISSVSGGAASEDGTQSETVILTSDENVPTVTLSSNPGTITENPVSTSTLTATLSVATYEDVIVNLAYSGTATGTGSDYTAAASITISAGNLSGTTDITSVDDAIYENNETIIADISSVSGGNASEQGTQSETITITSDETVPTVTLSSNPGTITENPVSTSTLTATLSVATYEDVIVNLTYSGTATGGGTDYTAVASITIFAGNLSGTTDITSVDDAIYENNETIIADIFSVSGGNVSEQGTQSETVTINDDADIPQAVISAAPLTISETGETSVITVTLSNETYENVIINLSYSGTATGSGTDYNAGTNVTISAGSLTGTTNITTVDDGTYEPDETIIVDISSVTGGGAVEDGTQSEIVTVTSDETAPTVTLNVSQNTINENPVSSSTVTATLSVATYEDVIVNLTYSGTATGGTDYTAAASITISAGSLSGTTDITSVNDLLLETDETIITDISNVTGGDASENGSQTKTVTIIDDETANADLSVTTDGNETGPINIIYTVTLSKTNGTGSSVTFNFTDLGTGTAVSGADYTAIGAGTKISVADGSNTGTLIITVIDDALLEADETLIAQISNPDNNDVTVNTSTGTANIIDNDKANAALSVTTQGNETGPVNIVFTVTLDKVNNTSIPVTFDFDDLLTGTATNGIDYTAVAGNAIISVADGSSTGTITIPVTDDNLFESTETVNTEISNCSNTDITITSNTASANIIDNENINATLSVTTQGNEAGPVNIVYTVAFDKVNNTGVPITFNFDDLLTGTATSGVDYTAVAGNAIISVADGESTGTITISVTDDPLFESDETILAQISGSSNSDVNIITDIATAYIIDNETTTANISVTTQGNEAGPVNIIYTVTLSSVNNTGSDITFDYNDLMTGTASSGTDYTSVAANSTVSIADGASTGIISIPVIDDLDFESDETVNVEISNCSNNDVSVITSSASANITDNEVATADLSVTSNGNESGPVAIEYTVTLSKTNYTGIDISFDFDDLGTGTAVSGSDYTAIDANAQITIADGSDFGTVTIPVIDDDLLEITETVDIQISNPDNSDVTIVTDTGTSDIIDNDTANADLIVTADGNESGPTAVIYTVTLSKTNNTGTAITFDFTDLHSGTATDGIDYSIVPANTQITINSDENTGTVTIPVIDDIFYEPTETVICRISNSSNPAVTISTADATANIFDDDYSDVVLTKTVDNNNPNEGDNITFTITVTNNGPSQLTSLEITDPLPAGLTFVSAVPSAGTSWSAPYWTVGTLDIGNSKTLIITVNVDYGTGGNLIVNTISNTQDQLDDNTTPDDDNEVIDVNDIPEAFDDTETIDEDNVLTDDVLTNDTGLNDGGIIVTVITDVINGILELNIDGTFSYTPTPDFHGTDSFVYQVCDADNECDNATVNITVNSVNDLPVAQDDDIDINEDSHSNKIYVLEDNGYGADYFGGDGRGNTAVQLISGTENGVLEFNDNGTSDNPTDDFFIYTTNHNFYGNDSFVYEICDIDGDCDQATVNIFVIDDKVLFIPEIITPNADGINDYFVIEGIESYPENSLIILNRWGDKVFEASPYNNDWNGFNNFGIKTGGKELPEGTYFYILKTDNNQKALKGYIYLKK